MNPSDPLEAVSWPVWRKILFRFFFIYLFLYMAPWTWLNGIPGMFYVTQYYYLLDQWAVETANRHIFHVREVLIPFNGSGDTSYGWAQLWLYLSLAIIGCTAWTLLDRKRKRYDQASYWLRTFTRYYIIFFALTYGIIKLFASQMYFPNESQLATPLGDFLPMRFSWLFIGYSTPYQVFAGVMEVSVGLLLLNRRTLLLGVLLGTGVFAHVVILNLCYDIPVKIFSAHLLLCCIFLLLHDSKRLLSFFVLNQFSPPSTSYDFILPARWMRISKTVLKLLFVVLALVMRFYGSWDFYQSEAGKPEPKPFYGIYDVKSYAINKDTIPALLWDSLRWKDVIFEKGGLGSVGSLDTMFRQRYRRGYFNFIADTLTHTIHVKKLFTDTAVIFDMRYAVTDPRTIKVKTKIRNDSLFLVLKKSNRHFQLAERQFHWLSERNR